MSPVEWNFLMSRPFSCPAPREITHVPITQGEGENAGIWPQAVHWFLWACAELGRIDDAWREWERVSLREHARQFPEVPYGIFNGPDCYSSFHAGRREGHTQVLLTDRVAATPMAPAIAWQAFSLHKINEQCSH